MSFPSQIKVSLVDGQKRAVSSATPLPVAVNPLMGHILLPNGERAQVKRAWTDVTIAQSQTDSAFIAAPADAQHYLVILGLKVMCDAATLVTFNSKGSGSGVPIDSPWPCGANGGFLEDVNPHALMRAVPGEAITITTGAGGNTYARAHFIEVPINVDIL